MGTKTNYSILKNEVYDKIKQALRKFMFQQCIYLKNKENKLTYDNILHDVETFSPEEYTTFFDAIMEGSSSVLVITFINQKFITTKRKVVIHKIMVHTLK